MFGVLEHDRKNYWKMSCKYIGFDVNSMVTQIVIIFESMTMLQRMDKFCCFGTKLILW
jgi:hypothetical protein